MKKTLLLVSFVSSAFFLFAQTKTLTGTITDSKTKEPMVGATVLVKGTKIGTATDDKGRFKLDVPADAKTLTISYVGYQPKDIPIGNTSSFTIVIESADIP